MGDVIGGKIKRLWHPVYDSMRHGTAGHTELRFFQDPVGAGVTSAHTNATGKKLVDTNMRSSGRLNRGRMQVQGIRVKYKFVSNALTNATDLNLIQLTGMLKISIGESKKIEQQLVDFNGGVGTYVSGASSTATTGLVSVGSGMPHVENFWKLYTAPFEIAPDQSIEAVMEWPAVVAITTACIITLQFEGLLDSEIVA